MPVNFPSISELDKMGGMDFGAYEQAQNQIGLANQFAQQGLQQGVEDLRAKSLANMYSEQINPLNVERQRLSNEGTVSDNQSKAVRARTDVALEDTDREAKRQKMLAELDEDKLKQLFAKGEALSLDPDPKKAEAGNRMREASWKEQQRRAAAQDALEQTKAIVGGRKEVAEVNAGARKDAAQIAADARAAKTSNTADFDTLILKYAKNPEAQAELRISRAEQLAANGDAAGAQRQLQLAAEARARAAEGATWKGLATPGVDVAAVANLPPSERPAARATVGSVGPLNTTNPNPVTTNARGNPVQRGDNAGPREVLTQELAAAEQRLKTAQTPDDQRRAQEDIAGIQRELGRLPGGKPSAPAAKPQVTGVRQGYIPIFKNGKAVGQVPASQAEAAKAQGYSLQ